MSLPTVLIPGLNCSAQIYREQIPHVWRCGPVLVADHRSGGSVREIAANILADCPPRFALVGFSLGGYIAFEILRQAAHRVGKLALIDTSARPDTAEQTALRRERMRMALDGRFAESVRLQFPRSTHRSRHDDDALRTAYLGMAEECGADVFVRHSQAIIFRPDSRPVLAEIRCPTMVIVGDSDALTPSELAQEMVAGIAGATLRTIAEAGHLTPMERPAAVTQSLLELLTGPAD